MPGKTAVVLDCVVQAQLLEVKSASGIRALEEAGGKVGDEKAEGRGEVEGLSDLDVELLEGDVLAVVRQDAVVCQGIEHRTGRPRVAFLGRDVLGPDQIAARGAPGDDMAGLVRGGHDVEQEEAKVPPKHKQVDEDAGNLVDDGGHGGLAGIVE